MPGLDAEAGIDVPRVQHIHPFHVSNERAPQILVHVKGMRDSVGDRKFILQLEHES